MFRIDDPTASSTLPTPEAANAEGYFTEGIPGVTPATLVRGSWLNMIQEELRAIVVAAAITPSKTAYNQVLSALEVLFGGLGTLNTWTGANRGTPLPLTFSATIALNLGAANNFTISGISSNFTLSNPTGGAAGQTGSIECIQNATGNFGITFGTNYVASLGTKPTLQAGASGTDVIFYEVLSTGKILVTSAPKVS